MAGLLDYSGLGPLTDPENRAAWLRSIQRAPATVLGAPVDLVNAAIGALNGLGGGKSPITASQNPVLGSQWIAEHTGMPTEPGSPYGDMAVGLLSGPVAGALGRGAGALESAIANARPSAPAGSAGAQYGALTKADLRDIMRRTKAEGGSTTDVATAKPVTSGYSVSATHKQTAIPLEQLRVNDLERFVRENPDANKIGTWISNGKIYLDPVQTVKGSFAAKLEAARNEQLAAYDLTRGKEVAPFEYGPPVDNVPLKTNTRPTVSRPQTKAFPDIYQDPRILVQRAADQAAPESPNLKGLFNLTRNDLDQLTLENQYGGKWPNVYEPKRVPEHVNQITVPANTDRAQSLLWEAAQNPKLAGSYGWYYGEPLREKFIAELGPVQGNYWYDRFHQLGSGMSPGSEVDKEILRSSIAYTKDRQGNLLDFLDPNNLPPEADAGHIYHTSAHASAVQRLNDTGNFLSPDVSSAPKTRVYYSSRVGDNYDYPTQDAHFMRIVGAPDVRPFVSSIDEATGERAFGPNKASVSATESAPLAHWFSDKVTAPLGMTGSPAQALIWNAGGPATGVSTQLSKPFLELFADRVARAAARKGTTLDDALSQWIRGNGDYLGTGAGLAGSGLLGFSALNGDGPTQ